MAGTRMSRRSMLGTVGAASLAPVLSRAMPAAGEPAPAPHAPRARAAFQARLTVGPVARSGGGGGVPIRGGQVDGSVLAGQVLGGRLEWQAGPGGLEVVARFEVRRGDGSCVQVCQRGRCAVIGSAPFSASAELTDAASAAVPALLVGRIDATRLPSGEVRVRAFEVS